MNHEKGVCILLVRHGETDWNRTRRFQGRRDIHLNERGREEADFLARAMKDRPISAIYSSPLIRAKQTAQAIKAFHPSAPLKEEKGLTEMDLGDFDGMEAPVWAKNNPDFLKKWLEAPSSVVMPGGESLPDVQVRAVSTISRIIQENPSGSTLVVCSHNFVIATIRCYALSISLDHFRKVKQETGTFTTLIIKGNQWEVDGH